MSTVRKIDSFRDKAENLGEDFCDKHNAPTKTWFGWTALDCEKVTYPQDLRQTNYLLDLIESHHEVSSGGVLPLNVENKTRAWA